MSGVPFHVHQAVRESFLAIAHCVLVYFQQWSIESILTSHYWEGENSLVYFHILLFSGLLNPFKFKEDDISSH